MRDELIELLVDLGDAVIETKGSQVGPADIGAGYRSLLEGVALDD